MFGIDFFGILVFFFDKCYVIVLNFVSFEEILLQVLFLSILLFGLYNDDFESEGFFVLLQILYVYVFVWICGVIVGFGKGKNEIYCNMCLRYERDFYVCCDYGFKNEGEVF